MCWVSPGRKGGVGSQETLVRTCDAAAGDTVMIRSRIPQSRMGTFDVMMVRTMGICCMRDRSIGSAAFKSREKRVLPGLDLTDEGPDVVDCFLALGKLARKYLPAMVHALPDLGLDRDAGPAGLVHELPHVRYEQLVGPDLDIQPGQAPERGVDRGCHRVLRIMAGKVGSPDRTEPGRGDPIPLLVLCH